MKKKQCKHCKGSETFSIYEIKSCDDCPCNGVYLEDDVRYVYDEEAKFLIERGMDREEVSSDSECKMGEAYGAGCMRFICMNCGDETHLPCKED